ncbi:hypothetical protein MRX96_038899 [Rhipicephalus microplus]
MIEPLPGAVTSTMKMTPKRKTPSLACKKTGGLQTTPSKTASSVPGTTATSKSELVYGAPPNETTYALHNGDNSPEKWTVDDVAEYVSEIPGCEHITEKFRHHKIDSVALFLIKEHNLMKMMNMKLGPALKMCATINSLR